MKPRVLFIVSADPRKSPRPAEAVRIAAGVGTWKKTDITIYLHGPAILALGTEAGELIGQEELARYWPILAESGSPICIEKNAAALRDLIEPSVPFKEISTDELAGLAAEQTYVIRF